MESFFNTLARSPMLSPRNFQYACAISGILCSLTFLLGFVASGFLPPTKPSWSAERTVQHYRDHEKGIQGGSALLVISGMFYLPLTAAISAQMRRIPNLHYVVSTLQLASGAAGIFTFMMPGMILAVANYSLDRPVEITKALNELFWITALMPWPTFMAQNFAFAYAIIIDSRPTPLFPKPIALLNIVVPVLFVPGIAIHCVKTGPLAWNGGWTFWLAGGIIWTETETGEKIVDTFPTTLERVKNDEEDK
ncbi:membrane protein [Thelonectria olida]|uniref:Membrane protein n=1 Tax=Thelonectria olida TaxID=1576542 RepID=A0A9P8VPQ6_9HYPO|nr:membrane protein [Thelonectria olida]